MISKYTLEEFQNAKSSDKLKLQCEACSKEFLVDKKQITFQIKNSNRNRLKYCSQTCHFSVNHPFNKLSINCKQCCKQFSRKESQCKKSTNLFCSKSCAATYNNQHKTKGIRVSKLEKWIAEQLSIQYPTLEIHYNRKDAINSELDIYIPSLKLAFELNGIFHYEPIYGQDKLNQIQNNDNRKLQACFENKISFCIIDVSNFKHFKIDKAQKYLTIITDIISKNVLLKS